ncbi:hypothetical protein HDU97_007157 [Phlyctochytrium planicorne]|nr:hypothetical protein HDU97_007157 [Phlyctochytrium planicorne]
MFSSSSSSASSSSASSSLPRLTHHVGVSPSQCSSSASFLVSDPSDREELAARLIFSSRGPQAASLVFPSDASTPASTENMYTPPQSPLAASSPLSEEMAPEADHHEDGSVTIHTIANFLCRNDTDREELVGMLRVQAARAAASAALPSHAAAQRKAGNQKGVYGLDKNDVFNQLVMLETPALSTAPIFSKL